MSSTYFDQLRLEEMKQQQLMKEAADRFRAFSHLQDLLRQRDAKIADMRKTHDLLCQKAQAVDCLENALNECRVACDNAVNLLNMLRIPMLPDATDHKAYMDRCNSASTDMRNSLNNIGRQYNQSMEHPVMVIRRYFEGQGLNKRIAAVDLTPEELDAWEPSKDLFLQKVPAHGRNKDIVGVDRLIVDCNELLGMDQFLHGAKTLLQATKDRVEIDKSDAVRAQGLFTLIVSAKEAREAYQKYVALCALYTQQTGTPTQAIKMEQFVCKEAIENSFQEMEGWIRKRNEERYIQDQVWAVMAELGYDQYAPLVLKDGEKDCKSYLVLPNQPDGGVAKAPIHVMIRPDGVVAMETPSVSCAPNVAANDSCAGSFGWSDTCTNDHVKQLQEVRNRLKEPLRKCGIIIAEDPRPLDHEEKQRSITLKSAPADVQQRLAMVQNGVAPDLVPTRIIKPGEMALNS